MADAPTSGFFTFIHHEGPIIEWSYDITERHRVIDAYKPEHERATRHRCIVRIPEDRLPMLYAAWAEYKRAEGRAWAEYRRVAESPLAAYQRVEGPALAAYQRVEGEILADPATLALVRELVPDCPWDGRTLFPDKPPEA